MQRYVFNCPFSLVARVTYLYLRPYDLTEHVFCWQDILGNICGFTVIVIAVMLLNSFKEVDISFQDMRVVWRCRRDHIKYTVEAEEESGQIRQIGPRQSSYGTPQL